MTQEELARLIMDVNFTFDSILDDEPTHTDDELQHYGVLGMKWGVRKDRKRKGETDSEYQSRMDRESRERQQMRDLSAREKQQKREAKTERKKLAAQDRKDRRVLKSQEKERQRQFEAQQKREEALRKEQQAKAQKQTKDYTEKGNDAKNPRYMTDEELRAAINRMQMEKQYKQMTAEPENPIWKVSKDIVSQAGKQIASEYIKRYATKGIDRLLENVKKKEKKS